LSHSRLDGLLGKLLNGGMFVTINDIEQARQVIGSLVQKTQLSFSRSCSRWVGTEVFLKFENEQLTGSFKIRGASNKILSLSAEEKAKGIVAASAGNHAQGVALAATRCGAKAHVVMPVHSPLVKITATKSYGAEVILHGEVYDESYQHARELEKKNGYIFVHPFDDPLVIAGQGTIGLEICEDLEEVDSVVIPIGGGGLIAGIATAIKARKPKCKIFGVVPENYIGMKALYQKVEPPKEILRRTLADGTAVKKPSQQMYDNYISGLVDDVVSVSEDQIAQAMVFLLERAKTVVEGSGALTLAAAAQGGLELGKKTCLLLCGGNIDINLMTKVIERGLARSGRIARLAVVVQDTPGTLNRMAEIIAEKKANILEVKHDRLGPHLQMRETEIDFLLETFNEEHVLEIRRALEDAGARLL